MPQRKATHDKEPREKNRLLVARQKRLSILPKTFKRPSDPEQAKEWLRGVADHLSNHPNAAPSFRFVAYAIKRYLKHPTLRLNKALGLVAKETVREGRPPAPAETVTRVTTLLVQGVAVQAISKQTQVSQSTINRIRADYNALRWETARQKVERGELIPDIEASDAQARELKISPDRRAAICEGIAEAIRLEDILPSYPPARRSR